MLGIGQIQFTDIWRILGVSFGYRDFYRSNELLNRFTLHFEKMRAWDSNDAKMFKCLVLGKDSLQTFGEF